MQSRMEKYYNNNTSTKRRSEVNQDLYSNIYDDNEYETVKTKPVANEIDIAKIKEMLREPTTRIIKQDDVISTQIEPKEERNYDIRDILNKAKGDQEKPKYHSLEDIDLTPTKRDRSNEIEYSDEEELKELIDTITNTSLLNKLGDKELSLNMLSDLESKDNTEIVNNSCIKTVIEEAKKADFKDEDPELDKSFYTASLGLTKEDFDELKDINQSLKKNNVLVKVLLFVTAVVAVTTLLFVVYNLIK